MPQSTEEARELLRSSQWEPDLAAAAYLSQQNNQDSDPSQSYHQQRSPPTHQPAPAYPFKNFLGLSVKGISGFNQVPHPFDSRPISVKAVPGTFQLPSSASLSKKKQNQVSGILSERQNPPRGGKSVRNFPRKGPRKSSAKSSILPVALQVAKARKRGKGLVYGERMVRIQPPIDRRDASYGKGKHFGHTVTNRKRPTKKGKS